MPCSQAPSSDPVVSQMNAVHILTPVPWTSILIFWESVITKWVIVYKLNNKFWEELIYLLSIHKSFIWILETNLM
jgi:hypothetical protein